MYVTKKVFLSQARQWGDVRFPYVSQNGMQFKTYGLFISGIFYVVSWHPNCPQLTEIVENETAGKGGRHY